MKRGAAKQEPRSTGPLSFKSGVIFAAIASWLRAKHDQNLAHSIISLLWNRSGQSRQLNQNVVLPKRANFAGTKQSNGCLNKPRNKTQEQQHGYKVCHVAGVAMNAHARWRPRTHAF